MSQLPFVIPPGQAGTVARDIIVPNLVRSAEQLASAFALRNVQIIRPQKSNFNIPENSDNPPDPAIATSLLGTIVLSDITFEGQTYQNEFGQSFTFPDINLQTVLLSVSQSKNIVKTAVQGRKGTVKEYIGLGDYLIKINAIICGANGVFPKYDVQQMITMCECPNAITVTSWYLSQFNVNSIVIEGYDINQDEGQYSRQPISISASSDWQNNMRFQ